MPRARSSADSAPQKKPKTVLHSPRMGWRALFAPSPPAPSSTTTSPSSTGTSHARASVVPLQSPTSTHDDTQKAPDRDDPRILVAPLMATKKKKKAIVPFLRAFGFLGAPLLFVICVSIAWTTWLIVLNIDPNATANYLMDTAEFDDGAFWLIIDPDPAFLMLTCVGLGAVLLRYLYAFTKMTLWRRWSEIKPPSDASRSFVSSFTRKVFSERTIAIWSTLTGYNGANRKLWNTWLEVVDLAFQLSTLHQILETGFPASLCYAYSALIATNCLSCVVVILNHTRLSAFGEVLIDTVFDMLTAVAAPIYLLVHSCYNFHFDRDAFRIVIEFAGPSAFERRARMSADPVQVTQFFISLNALRIATALDFVLRIGMNLSFAYRLKRVIEVMVQHAQLANSGHLGTQKAVPRWIALPFLVLSCGVLVYTYACVSASTSACSPHPQCAAFAQRAIRHDSSSCPCVALIDVDKTPKTYEGWANPPDATETVRALAASGDLQVLQVINRKLVQLPEELHRCTNLRHMYVSSNLFPSAPWQTKLTDFWFVQKYRRQARSYEPHEHFRRLAHQDVVAHVLPLGAASAPDSPAVLRSSRNLKSLSIAVLTSLQSIPSVGFLRSLERLQLLFLVSVQTAPDLGYLSHLSTFQMGDAPACCNGNLGKCGKTAPVCKQATCTTSDEIKDDPGRDRLFERFNKTFCSWYTPNLTPYTSGPTKERIDICEGVLYRKCVVPGAANGTAAMCFSNRMQAIACNVPVNRNIEIRKKQILQKVGTPCDPVEEAWLGCTDG